MTMTLYLILASVLAILAPTVECAAGEFNDAAIAVDAKPCAQIGM